MSRGPGLNALTIRLAGVWLRSSGQAGAQTRTQAVHRRRQRNHGSRMEKTVGLDHVAGRPSEVPQGMMGGQGALRRHRGLLVE